MITWRYIRDILIDADEKQLDDTATICDVNGEFYPVDMFESLDDDILDNGHLFLIPIQWFEKTENNEE